MTRPRSNLGIKRVLCFGLYKGMIREPIPKTGNKGLLRVLDEDASRTEAHGRTPGSVGAAVVGAVVPGADLGPTRV